MPTLYVTAPPEAADDLAGALVAERLAACVNRVPCESTYRWEGEVHTDDEEILLVKTTADRGQAVVDFVEERHPYDVPCIEVFEAEAALPSFADWIDGAVGPE